MNKIIIAILILLISVSASAEIGYWGTRADTWAILTPMNKTIYLQGLFDGIIFNDHKIQDTEISSKLSISQYSTAIDELYSDYKNSLIPVPFLLKIITLQIEGEKQSEIESLLVEYRKDYSK